MHKNITHKLILAAAFIAASVFSVSSVSSVSAADNQCLKAYGDTADEAFRAAVEVLHKADAELGPRWMKNNMQVRLLPDKTDGQYVAVVYSAVYQADLCTEVSQVSQVAAR